MHAFSRSRSERNKKRKLPPLSLIGQFSILFLTVVTIVVTIHLERDRGNVTFKNIETLVSNIASKLVEPKVMTCRNVSYSELIDAVLSICKSGQSRFVTFYLDGKPVAKFNETESKRFYDWIAACNPWKLNRDKCDLVLGKEAPCRRRTIFGHGFWMCYNHNYEFEKLVVAGLPFIAHDSLYVIQTLLKEF